MMSMKLVILTCLLAASQAYHININNPFASSRIINGEDAKLGQFPHHVSIQKDIGDDLGHICGGSIINERWILTGAQCTRNLDPTINYVVVKAGKYNLNAHESTQQNSLGEAFFWNANFTGNLTEDSAPYDIGLIKLKTPLKFNKYVGPISLPKKDSEPDGKVILSGWSRIDLNPEEQEIPNYLKMANFEIIDRQTCRKAVVKAWQENNEIHSEEMVSETNICTSSAGTSPCFGDSGSALINENEAGKSEIQGMVSWGVNPCGKPGAVAVYLRVSSFIDWIENIIANN